VSGPHLGHEKHDAMADADHLRGDRAQKIKADRSVVVRRFEAEQDRSAMVEGRRLYNR